VTTDEASTCEYKVHDNPTSSVIEKERREYKAAAPRGLKERREENGGQYLGCSLSLQPLPFGFQTLVKQLDGHCDIPLSSGYSDKTLASALRTACASWRHTTLLHDFDLTLTQRAYLVDFVATFPNDASNQVIWDVDLLGLLGHGRVHSYWKGSRTIGRGPTRSIIRIRAVV